MASLNKVLLIGRLGRDPELRYAQNGNPVCSFSMATDESYRGKDGNKVEQTEWHNVVCFGKQAEPVANYLHKGSMCYVEGSLKTRKWQAQDGSDRQSTQVNASNVKFLDSKRDSQGQDQDQQQQKGQQARGGSQPTPDDDLGPAFPSEASGMDDVPFLWFLAPVAATVMYALSVGGGCA